MLYYTILYYLIYTIFHMGPKDMKGHVGLKCRACSAGFQRAAELGDLEMAAKMARRALEAWHSPRSH